MSETTTPAAKPLSREAGAPLLIRMKYEPDPPIVCRRHGRHYRVMIGSYRYMVTADELRQIRAAIDAVLPPEPRPAA